MSKKYREFHYYYHPSDEPSQPLPVTFVKYIVDKDDNVLYYDLNESGWISANKSKLIPDGRHKFIRNLSKKELEKELFVENI